MRPRGDKGSEMSLRLLIFHPGTLRLKGVDMGQRRSPTHTANLVAGPGLIAQWSRATHVLLQGPLMCE